MTPETPFRESLDRLHDYVSAYAAYEKERESVQCHARSVIRTLRALSKISLRRFALLLEVSPSYLSKVERSEEMMSAECAGRLLCLYYNRGQEETKP